jgi:hypothetical protein
MDLTDGNNPSEYDELLDAEKAALQAWIQLAVEPADRADMCRNSYGMKHDFEAVGFYVTNGMFKGAMLAAGYQPTETTRNDINWKFRAKPRWWGGSRPRGARRFQKPPSEYALHHCGAGERNRLAGLVAAAIARKYRAA